MARFSLRIPKPLHRQLKIVALRNDISVNALISGAILACADTANPDAPLIVGKPQAPIAFKLKQVK
jgi:hypothetical protein